MVYMNDENEVEITTTNEDHNEPPETELEDIEAVGDDKLRTLREKLKQCDTEKKQALEDLQRERADFLNARKRSEEERATAALRQRKQHVEDLLPLCDSFHLAMQDKEAWEKADPTWRAGVEGIHNQLQQLLKNYQVSAIDPLGKRFDPHRDEAVGTAPVTEESEVDTVVAVIQMGYEMKDGNKTEIIRHARVTTGELKK